MKKLILPVIFAICFVFFLPQTTYSQTGPECMKIFDKEMKDCTTEYNACSDACMKEGEKPDGTAYFNAGEIYPQCMKESGCHEKSSSCSEQALTNYKACGKPDKQSETVEAKKETSKQNLNTQDYRGPKLPVFLGEWYELVSATLEVTAISIAYEEEKLKEKEREELEIIKKDAKLGKEEIRERITKINERRREYEALKNAKFFVSWGEGVEYKEPGSKEFTSLTPQHVISNGGIVQTKKKTLVRTPTALIELRPAGSFNEIPGVVEFQDNTIILRSGMMTVVEEKGADGQYIQLKTPKVQVKLNGTQVAITYDEKKDKNYVIVYEGEAEVKTADGQTINVKPDGDKPGVVVISRKVSITKLTILGVVLLTVAGGIVWFIKRKKKK